MKPTVTIVKRLIKRKIATTLLLTASLAAFATLGDGGKKDGFHLNPRMNTKGLSLRSTYNFRGNNPLQQPKQGKFIMLNTVVTVQKGNATYVLPLKKKVLIDKIKFGPTR